MLNGMVCSVVDCEGRPRGHGLCSKHYQRWRRHGDPLAGSTEFGQPAQWLAEVLAAETDDCVLWPGATSAGGYSQMRVDGRTVYVHRIVCERAHGPAPAGKPHVLHAPVICHQPGCINPRHLRWGSQKTNRADTLLDGTHGRSSRRCEIERRLAAGETGADIARRLGVSQSLVSKVKHGG